MLEQVRDTRNLDALIAPANEESEKVSISLPKAYVLWLRARAMRNRSNVSKTVRALVEYVQGQEQGTGVE